jgi:quinol monooxygenase YgiN
MSEEITIIAFVQALEGQAATVEAVIRACVEASRQEEGCLSYLAHTDSERPNRFVFVERWRDGAAVDSHVQTAHFQAFIDGLAGKLAAPLEVQKLKALP